MKKHRSRTIVGVVATVTVVALGIGLAFAFWVSTDSSNPASAVASSLSAPTAASVAESGATSVVVSWTNPGSQVTGAQYQVSQNGTPVCTTSNNSCSLSGLNAGTAYSYSVMAVLDNWTSAETTTSYSTGAVTITYPVNGITYGVSPTWGGTITGSASAATGSTITGVKLSLQQGSGASSCWTGSGATFTAACPNYVTTTYSAGSWSLGVPASDLTSGDTYSAVAQATDSLNIATTSPTVTFTYSSPPPSASAPGVSATQTYGTNPTWTDGQNVALTDAPTTNGGAAVTSVAYYYCPTSDSSCTSADWTPIGSSSAGGSWSASWTSLPADGTYNVVAVATNGASESSTPSGETEVGIDTAPPTVSTPSVNGYQ